MQLFDFSLRFNGYPIDKARRVLNEIHDLDTGAFMNYIETQKRAILSFHLSKNPFYASFAKDVDINNWDSVPVMTKRDLQNPLRSRLTDGFSMKSVYVNKTSGSSGDPFIFAKDKWCHALTWAVIMNCFSWYDIDFNKSRQARFYGIPLERKGNLKERFKDWLVNRKRFSVFDLSDNAFQAVLAAFEKTAFEYINGYTSPIVQFAKFLKRKGVILNSVCPSLRYCVVTSEMLFEDDKILMEHFFGVPVIVEYGASELDLIAFENSEGKFQINNETLYVEIVDDHGKVLPPGATGRIVITSLYNKAHPFIRYDIGDIGILSEETTSRTPILKNLVGRTNDVAILPSGKKAAGLTFYYITKSIIEDDGNVKEFVIEQLDLSHFKVSFVSDVALVPEKISIIKKEMENYLETGIDITFERKEQLERAESGKLKQFISHLNQPV